ncbi:Structural maintenance of chromosomes protein 3 [Chamberlinius hualienensis]
MYIKEVIISGFRNYRSETRISLSRGINVLVGENGSGKSSFLLALHLALGGELARNLKEHQFLLSNNGPSRTAHSAVITVILDNSCDDDRNRTTEKESFVTIRRMINRTTDKFVMNGQIVSVERIRRFYEAYGILQRNSYHYVMQGAITFLTGINDAQRYEFIVKAVSSLESGVKYTAANSNRDSIDEILSRLSDLLAQHKDQIRVLKEESQSLNRYKQLEKRLRMFKSVQREKELLALGQNYTNMQRQLDIYEVELRVAVTDCNRHESDLQNALKELRTSTETIDSLERSLEIANYEKNTIVSHLAQLECKYKDREKVLQTKRIDKGNNELQLRTLYNERSANDTEKRHLELQMEGAMRDATRFEEELKMVESKKLILELKSSLQGSPVNEIQHTIDCKRSQQQKELDALTAQILAKKTNIAKLKTEIEKINNNLMSEQNEMQVMDRTLRDPIAQNDLAQQIQKKDELMNQRRVLQREQQDLQEEMDILKRKLNTIETNLFKKRCFNYKSVKAILSIMSDSGVPIEEEYHSLVLDHIQCSEAFNVAVDIVGGAKMFYHIVETDHFATLLTRCFNLQRVNGSINMIAMNRVQLPILNTNIQTNVRTRPLIDHLTFDPKFARVMKAVFGRAMLCDKLPPFQDVKGSGWNFVTLDGDLLTSKGALSGGYYSNKNSTMNLQSERKLILNCYSLVTEQQLGERMKLIEKPKRLYEIASRNMNAVIYVTSDLKMQSAFKMKEQKRAEHYLDQVEMEHRVLTHAIGYLERSFANVIFTNADEVELRNLGERHRTLQLSYRQSDNYLKEWQHRWKKMESSMFYKAKKMFDLEKTVFEMDGEMRECKADLDRKRHQRTLYNNNIRNLSTEIERLENGRNEIMIDNIKKKVENFKEVVNKATEKRIELADNLKAFQSNLEHIESKLNENSLELGKISKDFENVDRDILAMSTNELRRNLESVKLQLNRINSKTINFFASKKHDILKDFVNIYTRRHLQHMREKEHVNEIILMASKYLTLQKKAIESVCCSFNNVFKKLVPDGSALLNLQYDFNTESEEASIIGANLKACFNKGGRLTDVKMLSNGENSIINLAIIIALHQFDQSLIHIMDEVDQNLDHTIRSRFGAVLQGWAINNLNCQYIISTFKPELVAIANRCLLIRTVNQRPSITSVGKDVAFRFLTSRGILAE